jgi:hypothetical protein
MIHAWWQEGLAWWDALPPLFRYLFALPFVVALLGLLSDRWRSARLRQPRH